MRANRTGEKNPPPKIENLKDGSFYYNFNVERTRLNKTGGGKYTNWDYNQVRCNYPIDIQEIQEEVDKQGYDHTVNLE